MNKKFINTESDFTLALNLPDGYDGDFRFVVTSAGRGSEVHEASRIGGVMTGCKEKDGQLYMVIRHGMLQPGHLKTKTYLWVNNEWVEGLQQMIPDGEEIFITDGRKNTDASDMSVDVLAPYLKGDKGEPLRYEDLTEAQKTDLTKKCLHLSDLRSQTGQSLDAVMSQKAVTEALGSKLDKVTGTHDTARAYCVNTKGEQIMLNANPNAYPYHMVVRGGNGEMYVREPQEDNEPTSKKYVDEADNALSERVTTLEGRKTTAKAKQMPWGSNDKVIVNKSIPLNARPGSKYFFEHWMSFRCFDPFILEKNGGGRTWKCSSEKSGDAVSKAVLVTIPQNFATECKSFYENNDREAIEAWLSEKKCVRDCTKNPYTGATTSPDFVVQSNRIICVKKIDLRPLLDYKGNDENKPALPSMIKDIISTKVEFARRRVVPEWESNLPYAPEGKDSLMSRNKHVIRKGWKNNPFEVIPLGRHGKQSIYSEKLIMSKYNTGHNARDNYFRFRKA